MHFSFPESGSGRVPTTSALWTGEKETRPNLDSAMVLGLMEVTTLVRGDLGHATVGVLTIIDEEFTAARDLLALTANIVGTSYCVAEVREDRRYATVLGQSPGRTNTTAEQATCDLIEKFRPHFLILIGIAGGVGEDSLGDVILAGRRPHALALQLGIKLCFRR